MINGIWSTSCTFIFYRTRRTRSAQATLHLRSWTFVALSASGLHIKSRICVYLPPPKASGHPGPLRLSSCSLAPASRSKQINKQQFADCTCLMYRRRFLFPFQFLQKRRRKGERKGGWVFFAKKVFLLFSLSLRECVSSPLKLRRRKGRRSTGNAIPPCYPSHDLSNCRWKEEIGWCPGVSIWNHSQVFFFIPYCSLWSFKMIQVPPSLFRKYLSSWREIGQRMPDVQLKVAGGKPWTETGFQKN